MAKTLLRLGALACVLSTCSASGSSAFGSSGRARVLASLAGWRSAAGGWGDAESTFDALSSYQQLGEKAPNGAQLCASLQKAMSEAVAVADLDELHHASASLQLLACPNVAAPAGTAKVLQAGLNDKDVEDIYHASQAAFALASVKSAPELDFSAVSANLLDLLEEDGTFRSTPEDEEGSAYHAGLALEVLGELAKKIPSAVPKDALRQVADKVDDLLAVGVKEGKVDFSFGAPAGVSPLEAAAAVIDGVRAIAAVVPDLRLPAAPVASLAEYILSHQFVANAQDADALTSSLQFLGSNALSVPLVASASSSGAKPTVTVSNVLGTAVGKVDAKVESVKGPKGAVLKDLTLTPAKSSDDNTEFTLSGAEFDAAAPGVYEVKFTATPKSGQSQDFTVRVLKSFVLKTDSIKADFALRSAEGGSKDKESEINRTELKFGERVTVNDAVDSSKNLVVKVRFAAGESYIPSSVAVVFRNTVAQREAMFLLKPVVDDEKTLTIKLSLGSSEVLETLSGAGSYEISIVIADAAMTKPSRWTVSTLNLTLPAANSQRVALDALFAPKAPISHLFRTPDARPLTLVSLVFTLLVLAPLAGLLVALAGSGISFSVPTNPSEFLYAAVFQGSIAAILLSYTLYWLSLNIFQALALLAVCGVVAVFSGTGALRLLHQRANAKGKTE